jgi:hypothetical protein
VICEHNASFLLHFEGKNVGYKIPKRRGKEKKKNFANSKQKFQNILLEMFFLCDSIAQEKMKVY